MGWGAWACNNTFNSNFDFIEKKPDYAKRNVVTEEKGKILAIMAPFPKAFGSGRCSLQLSEECFTRSTDTIMAK